MTDDGFTRTHAAIAKRALVAAVVIGLGVALFIALRSDTSRPTDPPRLIGTWAIARIDVGSAQHVSVPTGSDAEFSFTPGDWYPGCHVLPQLSGPCPGHPAPLPDALDLTDADGTTSCTYIRMGNTLAVIQCLSTLAPEVDQSPLDRAVSGAVEHAFKTNKTNRIAIAGAPDSGLTVTLGDVVFHLARNN